MDNEADMFKQNILTLFELSTKLVQASWDIEDVNRDLRQLELTSINVMTNCCRGMIYDLIRNVDTLLHELIDMACSESKESE